MRDDIKDLPIQRTIEVENSQGVTSSQITTKTEASSASQKQVTFGLAAVLLVIVAVVAVAVLLKNKS